VTKGCKVQGKTAPPGPRKSDKRKSGSPTRGAIPKGTTAKMRIDLQLAGGRRKEKESRAYQTIW